MKILYINSTIEPDSRTKRLAEYVLNKLEGEVTEVDLCKEDIRPLNRETLEYRTRLTQDNQFDNGIFYYAKQYAEADTILIAAPFWDLSFPAILKNYIESINVNGIAFKYSEKGDVIGLCNAERLIYITTAGGNIKSDDYGYGYIKALAQDFHGIKKVENLKAEGLDIDGADVEEILQKAEKKADKIFN